MQIDKYLKAKLIHLKHKQDRFWGKDRQIYNMYVMAYNVVKDILIEIGGDKQ